MTESTDPQAVAPATEAQAQPAAEVQSAQVTTPDLDALLGEFEAQTKPQPAPVAAAPQPPANDVALLRQEVELLKRQEAQKRDDQDLKQIINSVAGDTGLEDWAVEGWLSTRAKADPRINQIWNNRYNDPKQAKKLESALKAEFAKTATRKEPDKNATEDRMAVAAAVRGTSTKAPEQPAPKYGELNDAEFRKELAKYGL